MLANSAGEGESSVSGNGEWWEGVPRPVELLDFCSPSVFRMKEPFTCYTRYHDLQCYCKMKLHIWAVTVCSTAKIDSACDFGKIEDKLFDLLV